MEMKITFPGGKKVNAELNGHTSEVMVKTLEDALGRVPEVLPMAA